MAHHQIRKNEMKLLPFLFAGIFQGYSGHTITKRNAGPISATNLCINECTGVADDFTNFNGANYQGVKVDGSYLQLINTIFFINV